MERPIESQGRDREESAKDMRPIGSAGIIRQISILFYAFGRSDTRAILPWIYGGKDKKGLDKLR
jgi:hypothetical protein